MQTTEKILIKELIEAGDYDYLKSIRDGFLMDCKKFGLDFKNMKSETKELCEEIELFFQNKAKIMELIPEKTSGENGIEGVEFDFEIYHVTATVSIEGGFDEETGTTDREYIITDLQITLL